MCLQSVRAAGQIIEFDSFSTDQTLELARLHGAEIVQSEFDNFSDHKNWALDNIEFAYDWILIVDADESVTPNLMADIRRVIDHPSGCAGYYIARKNICGGRWIRHAGMYPARKLQLFQRGRARYKKRLVHEHMILAGKAGYLNSRFTHQDNKGIERYIERHNFYSSLEALEAYKLREGFQPADGSHDHLRKGLRRRRRLKQFAYRRLPFRPLLVFLWMYIFKLGFLDGEICFRYCVLRAIYEFQINLKLDELKRADSPLRMNYRDLLDDK